MNEEREKRNQELVKQVHDLLNDPESGATEAEERLVIMTLRLPKLCWLLVEGEANARGLETPEFLAGMLAQQVVLSQAMTAALFPRDPSHDR